MGLNGVQRLLEYIPYQMYDVKCEISPYPTPLTPDPISDV